MAAMTLDARDVLIEGWLTVYKSRNATFFTKLKVHSSFITLRLTGVTTVQINRFVVLLCN